MGTKQSIETTGEHIARLAERSFKDHQIEEKSRPEDYARVWRVTNPDTWCYGFYVTVWPGFLAINGDVGSLYSFSRSRHDRLG